MSDNRNLLKITDPEKRKKYLKQLELQQKKKKLLAKKKSKKKVA